MNNVMKTTLIRALTGNEKIYINARNSPMPMTYDDKHLFTTFISNAFVEFTALAMSLITVGII